MTTIQDVIKLYSDKLVEQESLKFNGTVAKIILNEFKCEKNLPQQFTLTLKRANIENNWVISILSSGKPNGGSIETPLTASILSKILTDAGATAVKSDTIGEYKFMFSLIPTND